MQSFILYYYINIIFLSIFCLTTDGNFGIIEDMKYPHYHLPKSVITGNYGIGLIFTDGKGTKWQSIAPQMPRELELTISTYIGVSPGAEHFYGKLTSEDLHILCIESHDDFYETGSVHNLTGGMDNYKPEEIKGFNVNLHRFLPDSEASLPKWKNMGYEKGMFIEAFKSSYDVIDEATRVFTTYFDTDAWLLVPKEKAYLKKLKQSLKYSLQSVIGG